MPRRELSPARGKVAARALERCVAAPHGSDEAAFLLQLGGVCVTGLAIWALVDKVNYVSELTGNNLLTGTVYVLLVGGIAVSVIAFFGCVGASREIKCMLLTVRSLPPLILP